MRKEKAELEARRLQQTISWIQALIRTVEYRQDYELRAKGRKHDLDLMMKYGIAFVVDPHSPIFKLLLVRDYISLDEDLREHIREDYQDFFNHDWAVEMVSADRDWIRTDKKGKTIFDYAGRLKAQRYMLLNIDLTKSKDRIMAEVEDFINDYAKYTDKPTGRNKPGAKINRYLTWDEFIITRNLNEVARKYHVDPSTVRKAYYRAVEDITGKRYDPDEHSKRHIQKEQLEKYCEFCDERDTCTDVCPYILGYVDSERAGQFFTTTDLEHERSTGNGDEIYSEGYVVSDNSSMSPEQSLEQEEKINIINQLLGTAFASLSDIETGELTPGQLKILQDNRDIFF
jgi:hypothetical protein